MKRPEEPPQLSQQNMSDMNPRSNFGSVLKLREIHWVHHGSSVVLLDPRQLWSSPLSQHWLCHMAVSTFWLSLLAQPFILLLLLCVLDAWRIVPRKVVYTGPTRGLCNAQNKHNDCVQLARVHLTPPLSHTLHCVLIVSAAQEGRTVKCPFLQLFDHKSSASVQPV